MATTLADLDKVEIMQDQEAKLEIGDVENHLVREAKDKMYDLKDDVSRAIEAESSQAKASPEPAGQSSSTVTAGQRPVLRKAPPHEPPGQSSSIVAAGQKPVLKKAPPEFKPLHFVGMASTASTGDVFQLDLDWQNAEQQASAAPWVFESKLL